MSGAARLGLGTAQFGLDYGITNRAGRVSETEARQILARASAAGIDTVDTAHGYGESEAVIGRCSPPDAQFRIVTKTTWLTGRDEKEAVGKLRSLFEQSLEKLGVGHTHALLIHDPADLLGPFADPIWAEMRRLKSEGLVRKIGVSVSEGEQLDRILDRFRIDIVQLPFNPLDQRIAERGRLERLAHAGIEVHARSLFLQGLLLERAERIPKAFSAVRVAVEILDRAFASAGLERLEGLLALAFKRAPISRFLCGVTTLAELEALLLAAETAGRVEVPPVPRLPPIDDRLLNPARWRELGDLPNPAKRTPSD